ncbi:uncharacterized protein LOC128671516 isoform X2 [Plodia interpunctella]|uniref:uncharacterized protein LOC128671516 isoform X2 n=1 Tax=Plodia interpunctella TaxID=58824 RepID=UPI002367A628|nr:uncharacterized protein LOC128671516 isoform X2 [Plodia interpunctella]
MDLKSIACVLIASSALQLLRVTDAQSQFSVPSECADDTICFQNRQKHLNYPQEEIDEILQNNPVFSNSYDDYDEDEEELELLNNDSNDEVNCKTYVTLEPPFFVKGDKWYPVVQSRYLTQNIRNVRCRIYCCKIIFTMLHVRRKKGKSTFMLTTILVRKSNLSR